MKNLALMMGLILTALIFAGCQKEEAGNTSNVSDAGKAVANKADTGSTAAKPSATASPANTAEMSKEEADKERSIPLDDIDTTKPMADTELKEKFTANPDEWKGKKVAVRGKLAMYMTSSSVLDTSSANRTQLRDSKKQPTVACISKDRPTQWDDIQNRKDFSKDVYLVFKGVVRDINLDHVALEPCQIVSMKEE